MSNIFSYLEGAWESVKPTMVISWVIISYVLFPTKAYETAAIGVAGAMVLDILTKYYALARIHAEDGEGVIKGLWRAVEGGHIRSSALWHGTVRKIISYLAVMILAGLAIRVSPIEQVAVWFATIVYAIMFFREASSVVENLVAAGHKEWEFLVVWLQKQRDSAIKKVSEKDIDLNAFKLPSTTEPSIPQNTNEQSNESDDSDNAVG